MSGMMNPMQSGAGQGRTVCITGAGCSQSAGIPTFKDRPDLRNLLTVENYNSRYYEVMRAIHEMAHTVAGKEPTLAHKLIAQQSDWRVITMNVDGLHQKAGTKNVLEVHGQLRKVRCSTCKRNHFISVLDTTFHCPTCGARLESPMVLYGQKNIPEYETATKMLQLANTVIIIGTSFENAFPCEMKRIAEQMGKEIHIFNKDADAELSDYLAERDLDSMF